MKHPVPFRPVNNVASECVEWPVKIIGPSAMRRKAKVADDFPSEPEFADSAQSLRRFKIQTRLPRIDSLSLICGPQMMRNVRRTMAIPCEMQTQLRRRTVCVLQRAEQCRVSVRTPLRCVASHCPSPRKHCRWLIATHAAYTNGCFKERNGLFLKNWNLSLIQWVRLPDLERSRTVSNCLDSV